MYIESEKVKFYPSAYRQYQEGRETKNTNPESELNTEYNITSHIAKLLKKNKGCFVVDYIENVTLEFYLGGYYIHITSPQDILNAFTDATEIWANMKVAPFTPTDTTKGFSELYEVVDYEDSGKNIDELNNNVVSFKGVAFLSKKDNSATFSLQLFTRQNTTKPWSILESSKYILDTREIFNFNGDYSIDEDFYTLYASIDDLYSETSSIDEATINTTLIVDGTTKFNSQVELNANLVPTSGSQVNIGQSNNAITNIYATNIYGTNLKDVNEIDGGQSSITLNSDIVPNSDNTRNIGSNGKEFATIYVNKIVGVSEIDNGKNNITLKSTIEPSGTIDLGLSTTPITNIYATNIYGTNLKDVNEIDGSQGAIILKSSISPDGSVDLGSQTNQLANIYASNITGTNLTTTTATVSNIKTTASNITLYKSILPLSTNTISLGNSNYKFSGIYATDMYSTNVYGTNLKDVNEIDGGQNSITLKSDLVPSGQVNLGSTTSLFNYIYTDSLTSNSIEALSLNVNDINSTASTITLNKTILPVSTDSISFGNSNFKFNDIYANTFYGDLTGNVTGNLIGNANTATKLNGNNVGNTSSSVYFNNGVPVVSNHYHYMLKDSSGTLTVPYNSSYPTKTPVNIGINSVYLKAGKYSFTITSQLDPIRGSDGTIVEVIIPEDLYVSARYTTTTTYTNTMFFKWWYYDNNQARQTWLYSRLSILHTVNTDNVKLQVQLGVGYSVGTTKQITWYDVPTTSMVVDYFD